jgi:hypothetical protein
MFPAAIFFFLKLKSLNISLQGGSNYAKEPIKPLGRKEVMNGKPSFWGLRLKKQLIILGLLGLSFLTGCATPYNQNPSLYNGAGLGAALGAGLGAAINHNNPWRGAAIGGLLGLAGGGLAGAAYGQSQTPYQPQSQGAYQPQQQQQGYYQPQQGSYQQQGDYQQAPYYGPPG